jgi:hypothetical protein
MAVFLVCLPLHAQAVQGRIDGGVFDQTGGAIAGATVTVTDVARGVARALTTDSAGEYSAPDLLPGTYTVRAEAKGFRTVEHTGILVQVGQDIRVDLTVQPGEQTQTITVTAEIPEVQTTNAVLGGEVNTETINDLPLNGRDFTALLALRPGVISYPGGGNFSESSNGIRPEHGLQLLNGVPAIAAGGQQLLNFQWQAGGPASELPIDSIQGFNIQENPKAEYGWIDGQHVNIGLKSGTNSLHGTAYAFGRDTALDARNVFNPPTLANGAPNPKTPVDFQQFGASAGGPILKDKLFWFSNYEGQRYTVGNLYVASAPVTTSIGNSQVSIPDACNALLKAGKTISPLSAQLAGVLNYGQPGGAALGQLCQVSPASSTVESLFPVNNGTYTPSNPSQYAAPLTSHNPEDNGVAKVDYHINDHHSLSGSYFIGNNNGTWVDNVDQLEPRWQELLDWREQVIVGNWTWIPNSSWVNEVRFGHNELDADDLAADKNVNPSAPWPTGYGINTGVTNPLYFGFPYLQISGFNNFALGAGRNNSIRGPGGVYDFVDNVSYLRGKHSFKFGGEFLYQKIGGDTRSPGQGTIKFGSLRNYLLGIPSQGGVLTGNGYTNGRQKNVAAFFQDDWRFTTRLTLNLGLRWEGTPPPSELNNLYSGFNPNLGMVQFGVQVPSPVKADYREFAPRVGFAWDVTGKGKTVVRGGASILYETFQFASHAAPKGFPFGADIVVNGVTTPGSQLGAFTASYTGPELTWNSTGPVFPITSAIAANRLQCGDGLHGDPKPCSGEGIDPNFRPPQNYNWNLDVQKALTNSLTLDVAYVGTHAEGLIGTIDLNQDPIGAGWFGPHNAAAACIASQPLYNNCNPSTADETAARPFNSKFPYLRFITQDQNLDESNYNGLQVTLTQRTNHGLYFLAGYTYSHTLDDLSSFGGATTRLQNAAQPGLEYGNSDYDMRHRFSLTATYLIPGKKAPGQMLEGWQLNSVVSVFTGLPWFAMDTSDDFSGTGETNNSTPTRWSFTGNPSAFTSGDINIPCYGPLPNCTPFPVVGGVPQPPAGCMSAAQANGQLAVASLMNYGCYMENGGVMTPPAFGSIGTMGRNIFRDQGYQNWDMSIFKNWKFKERLTVQFRAEFFNVLNHPHFSNPWGARTSYANNDPSGGLGFGCGCITPDAASGNFVLGSGGNRDIELGLKLIF